MHQPTIIYIIGSICLAVLWTWVRVLVPEEDVDGLHVPVYEPFGVQLADLRRHQVARSVKRHGRLNGGTRRARFNEVVHSSVGVLVGHIVHDDHGPVVHRVDRAQPRRKVETVGGTRWASAELGVPRAELDAQWRAGAVFELCTEDMLAIDHLDVRELELVAAALVVVILVEVAEWKEPGRAAGGMQGGISRLERMEGNTEGRRRTVIHSRMRGTMWIAITVTRKVNKLVQ